MTESEYEKIIKSSKRVDWYGVQVPEKLITQSVIDVAQDIIEGINKFESENETSKNDTKKSYIKALWENIRTLPYRMNGDVYLKIKDSIETEDKKPKTPTPPKIDTPTTVKVRSIKKTK